MEFTIANFETEHKAFLAAQVQDFIANVDFFTVWEEFGEFRFFDDVAEIEAEDDIFWAREG